MAFSSKEAFIMVNVTLNPEAVAPGDLVGGEDVPWAGVLFVCSGNLCISRESLEDPRMRLSV